MTIYKNKRLARTLDNETVGKVLNPLLMVQVFSKALFPESSLAWRQARVQGRL